MTGTRKRVREISRIDWNTQTSNEAGWPADGVPAVNLGCQMRIADALERIAHLLESNASQQRTDLKNARATNRRLRTEIQNLRAELP